MAEQHREGGQQQQHGEGLRRGFQDRGGPSASKVLTVATILPVGGILLGLSGMTLTGTLIGLAVATPLFLLFSPILVPAAIVLGLAVAGFLTSGALGLTALSSLSWILNYLRRGGMPEAAEHAKRRMGEAAGQVGQRAKDVGHAIDNKARERS